ncbi:unnamed protein product [Rotaria sordida]|uniref:Uncharacterized protein n=1 Tax=Rotaria sordida TaxID=392033 RepID=A0A820CYP2_9BILA|nr:unnamed protein product [Rotaria sordida]CAF4302196.1 unnamed protein product [Rotaria sordida]
MDQYVYNFQTGDILKQLTLTSSSLPILTVTVVDIITGTDVFTTTSLSDEQSFNKLFYSSQRLIIGLINGSCDVWNLRICEKKKL